MAKKEIIITADYLNSDLMSLDELYVTQGVSPEFIRELISFEIIHDHSPQEERLFDMKELRRIKTALRLQRDLEVNLAGVAVILDLLQELEHLRTTASLLDRHFIRNKSD